MDRFASMHDEDIDKLGIPRQGPTGRGDGGWKGRKRARELSELKGRLDRASEKEQQSWDQLKQAVEGSAGASGSIGDEGRFKATGTSRAAEEMRERTIGLVTAEEFRKAREAADSLEAAETKQREDKESAEEDAKEALRRKADKKKRKAAEKKRRLEKSKMSFALEDDEQDSEALPSGATPAQRSSEEQETNTNESSSRSGQGAGIGEAGTTKIGAERPEDDGVVDNDGASFDDARTGESAVAGAGVRSLKGAAPDQDNSSAAAMIRERLGR